MEQNFYKSISDDEHAKTRTAMAAAMESDALAAAERSDREKIKQSYARRLEARLRERA